MDQLHLRAEGPDDARDVRAVNEAAFGRAAEADLVDALRARLGERCVSLVAARGTRVIGHILFSPLRLEPEPAPPADPAEQRLWALGPMAVEPSQQRWGVGAALVRAGIDACRERGGEAVFVLGHATYYPRFGFRRAGPLGFSCVWPVPEEVFRVLELRPGALEGRSGQVLYEPEFSAV